MPRGKLKTNTVKHPYVFRLMFTDGRIEEVEVQVDSFSAAVLALPRFAEVGKYRYELVKGPRE